MQKINARSGDEARYTLWCDTFRTRNNQNELWVLSVAGPATAIKSVRAVLYTDPKARFGVHQNEKYNPMRPKGVKFKCHAAPLGVGNTWHLVAYADVPELLLDTSDAGLWARLSSDAFTTPLLREWLPYLRDEITERGAILPLDGWGHPVSRLTLTDGVLDDIVRDGLRSGAIAISQGAVV